MKDRLAKITSLTTIEVELGCSGVMQLWVWANEKWVNGVIILRQLTKRFYQRKHASTTLISWPSLNYTDKNNKSNNKYFC